MFACQTLINSDLRDEIEWLTIDTTASTNKERSFIERINGAILRIKQYFNYLITERNIAAIVIFSSAGFSFKEKGILALIGKLFRKNVIFAPRSGLILDDIERSSFNRWWIKLVFQKVDKVLCQSETWQSFYHSFAGGSIDKYFVIHNWIDAKKYFANRSCYNNKFTNDTLNILFLGWVTPNKGIFEVIEAAESLRAKNIKFIVAGDGDAWNQATELVKVKKLTSLFNFVGWVNEKNKLQLLQKTDIYIMPSHREGYPNALMEAMASSLPCIATNVGAIPDLIQDNYNGLLFSPKNVQQFVECLNQLIDNPTKRTKIGQRAKQRIKCNNTIDAAVTRFKLLLESEL